MERPAIVCITPVRNEAWLLDRFLQSTSLWADYIVISDQKSTDGSREIMQKYPKVTVVDNNSTVLNETENRRNLISIARTTTDKQKLIIGLDADEILTPEVFQRQTWNNILNAEPGTVFQCQWANIMPDKKRYIKGYMFPIAFMDNGERYVEEKTFHSKRIPTPPNCQTVDIQNFSIMHLQWLDSVRNERKQRWYQCQELLNPSIAHDAISIYRTYHYHRILQKDRTYDIPSSWVAGYDQLGIDVFSVDNSHPFWYDDEVDKLFKQYGYNYFHKLDIWQEPFTQIDPRTLIDKIVHIWLRKSQPHYFTKARRIDDIIRKMLRY